MDVVGAVSSIISIIQASIELAQFIHHATTGFRDHQEVQRLRHESEQISSILQGLLQTRPPNLHLCAKPIAELRDQLEIITGFVNDLQHNRTKILRLFRVGKEIDKLQDKLDQLKSVFNIGVNCQVLFNIDTINSTVTNVAETLFRLQAQSKFVSPEISLDEVVDRVMIHKGENGEVYSARYKGDKVAVKIMHQTRPLSADAKRQFEQEVRMASSKTASNVVRFYGACTTPAKEAIVMELMKGNLHELLHASKVTLSWKKKISMAREIACGLNVMHEYSVMHRNLNSFNVLYDENYHCKLTDFGLAKFLNENLSNNQKRGMAAWNAPETPVYTKQSDIYSFGIILWEIAARKKPFQNSCHPTLTNEDEIRRYVLKGGRENLESCNQPGLPGEYVNLIKACWAQDPEVRPSLSIIISRLDDMAAHLPKEPVEELIALLQECWEKPEYRALISDFHRTLQEKINATNPAYTAITPNITTTSTPTPATNPPTVITPMTIPMPVAP